MSSSSAAVSSPVVAGMPPRRAYRDLGAGVVGGVAAGLAHHLRARLVWVRVAFVVAGVLGGFGIAVYAALWLLMPAGSPFRVEAPGLESASRGGRRPGVFRRIGDLGPVAVLSVLALGGLFALGALLGGGTLLWPLLIGLAGVALLWRQADEAQRARWLNGEGRVDAARVVLGDGGWAAWARLASGLLLIGVAAMMLALRGGSLTVARDVTVAALLGVLGIGIVVGPWVLRLLGELSDERAERIRTQERADVAAHLHDSVLQTLALIQRNAGDAGSVTRLARAQERDLRSWLYGGEATGYATVAAALRAVAAEVEDVHGVAVDVVTVGDAPLDRAAAAGGGRGAGVDDQCGQARGRSAGRRLRRDRRGRRRRVRARPRRRLRARAGGRGSVRRPQQHRRPHAAVRRVGRGALGAGGGHRGPAAPAAPHRTSSPGGPR